MCADTQRVTAAQVAHILVATEAEANQVLDKLAHGTDFGDLASQYSLDLGSRSRGGVYDWLTRYVVVEPFAIAAFEQLQPGETTLQPVQTAFGYHIIRVLEHHYGSPLPDGTAGAENFPQPSI